MFTFCFNKFEPVRSLILFVIQFKCLTLCIVNGFHDHEPCQVEWFHSTKFLMSFVWQVNSLGTGNNKRQSGAREFAGLARHEWHFGKVHWGIPENCEKLSDILGRLCEAAVVFNLFRVGALKLRFEFFQLLLIFFEFFFSFCQLFFYVFSRF